MLTNQALKIKGMRKWEVYDNCMHFCMCKFSQILISSTKQAERQHLCGLTSHTPIALLHLKLMQSLECQTRQEKKKKEVEIGVFSEYTGTSKPQEFCDQVPGTYESDIAQKLITWCWTPQFLPHTSCVTLNKFLTSLCLNFFYLYNTVIMVHISWDINEYINTQSSVWDR